MSAFLLELAWKSSAVIMLAFALGPLLRLSARSRALVFLGAALVLLLMPATMVFAPSVTLAVLDAPSSRGGVVAATAASNARGAEIDVVSLLYLVGLGVFLIRILVAVSALALWTARAQPISDPRWSGMLRKACARSHVHTPVRLLASGDIVGPLSWGWLRPTILIDTQTLARAADAKGVLEHELAHVRRGDWLHLMTLHFAAAIFWFNPLVWLMKRAAQMSVEEAADALALRTVAPADYAQALLNCVRRQTSTRALAANTMACNSNSFTRRMAAILASPQRTDCSAQPAAAVAILALCAAPIAAAEFTMREPSLSHGVESVMAAPVQTLSRAAPASRPSQSPGANQATRSESDQQSARNAANVLRAEIAIAQTEAERLRARAIAADAVADGDPGDMGRADGMHGRADAAQGRVHALRGDLARLEAADRRRAPLGAAD